MNEREIGECDVDAPNYDDSELWSGYKPWTEEKPCNNNETREFNGEAFLDVPGNKPGYNVLGCNTISSNEIDTISPNNQYVFREFKVKKLNYGYLVNIGCHQMAIESKETLKRVLCEYIDDPNKKETEWWKNKTI